MKAVVLEVRGREAALLMADGTVRRARGRFEVGQEVEYTEPARLSARQWVAAVIVAALLLAGSAGMWINANYVACAEVSLDAEPSFVYRLNRRNRVLSVRAANADAEPLVETLQGEGIRFATLSDAVEKTLDLMAEAGYLSDGAEDYVLASVASDDAAAREALAGQVETAIEKARARDATLEYRVDRVDRATAREARESGMSPGRYGAWKQSSGEGRPEDFAEAPVRQLLGHEEEKPEAEKPEEKPVDAPRQEEKAEPEKNGEPAEKPQAGDAPKTGDVPESRGEPQSGDKPEARGEPQSGDKPEARGEPQSGDKPEDGDKPQSGDKPEGGDQPAGGEKEARPSGGGGGEPRQSGGGQSPQGGQSSQGGSQSSRGGGQSPRSGGGGPGGGPGR